MGDKDIGASDALTEMLASEEGWIVELISKRNAAEHPGGYSGTLYIENIKSAEHERFILPTWRREESPPTDIFADLETCLDNMLTLAEEILTSCIMHKTVHQIIQFAEIPSGDRNPNCPMRLIVQLDKAKIKSPS